MERNAETRLTKNVHSFLLVEKTAKDDFTAKVALRNCGLFIRRTTSPCAEARIKMKSNAAEETVQTAADEPRCDQRIVRGWWRVICEYQRLKHRRYAELSEGMGDRKGAAHHREKESRYTLPNVERSREGGTKTERKE